MSSDLTRHSNDSTPLYEQVKEIIKKEIESGQLRPGDKVLPERELAKKYNVSRITTVRALSDLGREGILERLQGKGSFVAEPARKADQSYTIGIGLYESQYVLQPFFNMIIQAMTEEASSAGYQIQLIVTNNAEGKKNNSFYEGILKQKKVDGLAIVDHALSDADIIDLHNHNVPIVLFDRTITGHDFRSIMVDNRGGIFQAVEYLHGLGHRQIGLAVHEMTVLSPMFQRYEGFRAGLDILGIGYHPEWVLEYVSAEAISESDVIKLMGSNPRPTAIVCSEDYAAIRISDLLRKLGYKVPRDVSVTGFDNIPQSASSVPSITTVNSGLPELGHEMIKSLLKQIKDKTLTGTVTVSRAQLVTRESTSVPPNAF